MKRGVLIRIKILYVFVICEVNTGLLMHDKALAPYIDLIGEN